MPITASSTLEEIEGQYLDNVDWLESGSLAKAAAFAAAVRALMIKKPTAQQLATLSIRFDVRLLKEQLDEASEYVKSHPDSPQGALTTYLGLESYR
ncbi:MAG: hypothetical protein KF847_19655 [Pirellulales bacterium]|nr:hypothetical protein [Pirellulales bacterium]